MSVIIIGAGLSGLAAAFRLQQNNIPFQVLEARNRAGGRIKTLEGPLEMGATWFGDQHQHLKAFLESIDVAHFEQYIEGRLIYDLDPKAPAQLYELPPGQAPTYRVAGGTSAIIQRLIQLIGEEHINYNVRLSHIVEEEKGIVLSGTDGQQYQASHVISTIPPQLMARSIETLPALPEEVREVMLQTHTWMGESIKFGVSYPGPFWRDKGLSGMGFGQTGVIQEVHDHTSNLGDFAALKGFLNPELRHYSQKDREALVIAQLEKMFGPAAKTYTAYTDEVWKNEAHTSVAESGYLAPHQNNGHPLFRTPLLNGKLILGGTEVSAVYPGYMEGAVYSGTAAAQQVITRLNPDNSVDNLFRV